MLADGDQAVGPGGGEVVLGQVTGIGEHDADRVGMVTAVRPGAGPGRRRGAGGLGGGVWAGAGQPLLVGGLDVGAVDQLRGLCAGLGHRLEPLHVARGLGHFLGEDKAVLAEHVLSVVALGPSVAGGHHR